MWLLFVIQLANGGNYVGSTYSTLFDSEESCTEAKAKIDEKIKDQHWQVKTVCVKQ